MKSNIISKSIWMLIAQCFIVTIFSCRNKNHDQPEECNDSCMFISKLNTKTDYYAPINLYNDITHPEIDNIILNNEKLKFKYGSTLLLDKSGFYKLVLDYKATDIEDKTLLFTLVTKERENAEWGIEAWIPRMFSTSTITSQTIEAIYPRNFTSNIKIPFIFFIKQNGSFTDIYSEAGNPVTGENFYIKRGVGSINEDADQINKNQVFSIGGKTISLSLSKSGSTITELDGELTEDLTIKKNSIVRISSDLHIASNASLTIQAGTILIIDEAVNINNDGPVNILGESQNPVLITCSNKDKYWGGFISNGQGSRIIAKNTIFCQSGYHDSSGYRWGHAGRQALFYTSYSELNLDHCYMLDNIGQIFYPQFASLTLESILVQRAKTSGQLNNSNVSIRNSIFTDFPDDSRIYQDEDNDALYLNASDVTIDNCIFMFAKDDGLDSGGDLGGTVTVTNSRFEACFHEGAALSSSNDVIKSHTFLNCIFTNCGQGLELGFSSPNHTVLADNCQFLSNYIGIRYGDNYTWSSVNGHMMIRNSVSYYNSKDVWNMVRSIWSPKLENLTFENTKVSSFVEQYPELEVKTE